jgi:Ca2+-binding EF-hand superfamily protein
LSGNTQTKAELNKAQGGTLARMLDLLGVKLNEKVNSMAEAYRYFDVNYNNRVSFAEFQKALDHMRIKFTVPEL